MIRLQSEGVYLLNQTKFTRNAPVGLSPETARDNTIAYHILRNHETRRDVSGMRLRFDALISHDITYVGIIQTARASGLKQFPLPYAMTNCHNSLCAVGGTINEDDHVFGLSAAKKYGGIYVPANEAVIHQYAREALVRCGAMILGSDSHTRYGAYGTMGFGEGGPELVKQLLNNTYDIPQPEVVAVYLTGKPGPGIGPHDVALALCGAVFKNGFVKNRILEFIGPGVAELSADFRIGIDVMTTETACLSSIWQTDDTIREYYKNHGREEDYKELLPGDTAYYDRLIEIDLSTVESMIALPFHPSNAYTIREFKQNAAEILAKVDREAKNLFGENAPSLSDKLLPNGDIAVDQGEIAGCAGGLYENLLHAAAILKDASVGQGTFSLNVYPASAPIALSMAENGISSSLMRAGAVLKPCFCGPCFGAGDVPSHGGFSIRHTTRNFPNREGSRPGDGQLSYVALMDARSIAATAANGGILTAADEIFYEVPEKPYHYESSLYEKRVYAGFGKANPDEELKRGPNITDWPEIPAPKENLLVRLAAVIRDEVTTTDELIPSGETSSYRSNPIKLSEFALSRREPAYTARAKEIRTLGAEIKPGSAPAELTAALSKISKKPIELLQTTSVGSAVFAKKPGDGSAREQAASCQKVLGGFANFCYEYATKRYRSNCINWGLFPFTLDASERFPYENGDYIFIPGLRSAVENGTEELEATVITASGTRPLKLYLKGLTGDEKQILLDGCLMNYYAARQKENEA